MEFFYFFNKLTLKGEKRCFLLVSCLLVISFLSVNSSVFAQGTCLGDGCKGINLVTNGGFEDQAPNSGSISPDISTDFGMIICPPGDPSNLWGNVLIAKNPLVCYKLWDIKDHTFGDGSGNMMVIDFPVSNPAGTFAYMDIWSKTIQVDSGRTYCFGAWFKNLNSDSALSKPNFRFVVDNTLIGISPDLIYDSTNTWTYFGYQYTSTSTGSITISIQNGKWGGEGNDLAMDDVEFREVGNGLTPPVAVNDAGGTLLLPTSLKTFYVTNNDTLNTNAPVTDSSVSISSIVPDTMGTATVDISGNIVFQSNGNIGNVIIFYEYCQPSTGCCDMAAVSFIVDIVLPNTWIENFHGEESYGGINLNWESLDEPDNVTYELKRSFDQKAFTKVALIEHLPGKGKKSYRYLDTGLPFNGEGYVYYELTATDADGNYYEPLKTQFKIGPDAGNSLKFRVFPNPVNGDILNILFKDPVVRDTEISLSNLSGQVFKRITIVGQNKVSLDIQNLPAGVYFISASDGRLKEVLKFQVYN